MKYWRMANGRRIRIRVMRFNHIQNAMNMLKKMAERMKVRTIIELYAMENFFQGDIAQYEINRFEIETENASWEEFVHPIYYDLKEERDRRLLKAEKRLRGTKNETM